MKEEGVKNRGGRGRSRKRVRGIEGQEEVKEEGVKKGGGIGK